MQTDDAIMRSKLEATEGVAGSWELGYRTQFRQSVPTNPTGNFRSDARITAGRNQLVLA